MSDDAPYRILLLEDDPDMCASLAEVLEEEGYAVETAHSGVEAVEKAAGGAFDLMITDVRMAGMDGLEALGRVKQNLPNVASLVITGYAGDADSIRALRLGAGDYLKKPFELADFLGSVERLLSRRQAELARRGREEATRRLAVEALEALALAHGLPAEAGRLARSLGRELGLDAERCEEMRLAALLGLLRHRPHAQSLTRQASLPPVVRRALRALDDEGADPAALPTDARVVLAALSLADDPDLSSLRPGVLDTPLEQAVEAVRRGDDDEDRPAVHGPQLVSLACALEAAGDLEGADRAFASAAAGGRREAVEALLGRARLAASGGRLEDLERHLDEAVARARALGPVTYGRTLLDAGLAWMRLGHDGAARPLLERAAEALTEVQAQPHAALARVASSATPDEAALHVLARPEFADDRVSAAPWLLARLAALPGPNPVVERLLGRLVREVPRQVGHLFERGVLGVEARRALVAALVAEGKSPTTWVPAAERDDDPEVRRLARMLPEGGGEPPPPLLRLHAMGPFEAWMGETRIPDGAWVSSKIKYLCAFLAAQNGAEVTEDVIIERFWPGELERGRRSLYNAKAVLSRCLQPGAYIVRQRGTIRLDTSLPCWHDADDIERLSAKAARRLQEGHAAGALDAWRRVAALYRGPYLDGCYMDWALEVRTRLERLATTALTRLLDDAERRRHHEEALEYAGRLLDIDACNQEAHAAAMRAFLASGRPEQAVRQFDACRRKLRDELEMEPSIALIELQQRARLAI